MSGRVIKAADLATLHDGAAFLTKGLVLFRKYTGWYGEGIDGYIRNQWVYPHDTQGNMPYKVETFTGWQEQDWFPAIVIYEGES